MSYPMSATDPLFAGLAIFGPAAYVRARAAPVARTWRGFPGVNGLLTKRLGSRGAVGEADGLLFDPTRAGLDFLEGNFELLKIAGTPYTLVDSLGRAWPRMILIEFDTVGPLMQDPNGFARQYRASFRSLSLPVF